MPSDYLLIPEHPNRADVRKFIAGEVSDIYRRLAEDRLMLSPKMGLSMWISFDDAMTNLSNCVADWLEANDSKMDYEDCA